VQIGRQGDAGGLKDAVDLAGDGGDALPSFSMVASWRRSRVAQQVASSDKSGRGNSSKPFKN
jgi:hypothetical protein